MARKVFFSFHYNEDCWRVAQVRNAHLVEGNAPVSDNDWESIKRGGDPAIERWIDRQLDGKSCAVVMVGAHTAGRKWINREITKAWNAGKGVVGVRIHNLKDSDGRTSGMGANPFAGFNVQGTALTSIVKTYNPSGYSSSDVYNSIKENIEDWVEEAITIRSQW